MVIASNSIKQNNPFYFMAFFYIFIGFLVAIQNAFIDFGIIDSTSVLSWVRIHFITLGILSQVIFGYVPSLFPSEKSIRQRWDIWALLNTGLFTFFYGRSLASLSGGRAPLMIVGGLLIFIATFLFILQLSLIRNKGQNQLSGYFYIFGSVFLLVGIIVGISIWAGWTDTLGLKDALEVHIHANNWGFMAMIFTGLFLDILPNLANYSLKWPSSVKYILVLEVLGATGLVIGPWLAVVPIIVLGMMLFLIGTIIMLLNILLPLRGKFTDLGYYHIVSAYIWIVLPLIVAPFVILKVSGFGFVEANAPQALIYGWVLQVGFAFVPYFLASHFGGDTSKLGSSLSGLILVNLGAGFLWLSIFIRDTVVFNTVTVNEALHGIAYVLWALSLLPFMVQSYRIISSD